jgi:hypothetical protein
MTEKEFFETMDGVRDPRLRGVNLPIASRGRENRERIKPFFEDLIERLRAEPDPRSKDDVD